MSGQTRKWRPTQFRLRTLLLLVIVVCVWLGFVTEPHRCERKIVGRILGNRTEEHWPSDSFRSTFWNTKYSRDPCSYPNELVTFEFTGPKWLRKWLKLMNIKYFDRVTSLFVYGPGCDDSLVDDIVKLKGLRSLELHGTKISPEGINLIRFRLVDCKVTNVQSRWKLVAAGYTRNERKVSNTAPRTCE